MTRARSMKRVGTLVPDPATRGLRTEIDLAGRGPGIHQAESTFFELDAEGRVLWVTSRACEHANGRLSLVAPSGAGCRARCPLHGWELDLTTRRYTNVGVEKPCLPFEVRGTKVLVSGSLQPSLVLPEGLELPQAGEVKIRFLAHAALAIELNGFTVVTDPWLIGPCFTTGWWHAVAPKADALDVTCRAHLLYISHNHPDHLHRATLQHVLRRRPDVPIMVPPFPSGSTARLLRDMGFSNVIECDFNSVFRPDWDPRAPAFAILKSGDFRDDSGLYIAADGFTGLLTVDAAALNGMSLPTHVDFLATAFAAGATGFPWCFDHLSLEERHRIQRRNTGAVRKLVADYVDAARPRIYMPYAGFFTELAARDAFSKGNNRKNSPDAIRTLLAGRIADGLVFVDPRATDTVRIPSPGAAPELSTCEAPPLFEVSEEATRPFLEHEAQQARGFDLDELARYLERSGYRDDLLVTIVPCDADFVPLGEALLLDPTGPAPRARRLPHAQARAEYDAPAPGSLRKIWIRVRQAALADVVRNTLPWEDLSIGFQCRIECRPDIYESHFWFHFTNVFVGSAAA